MTQEADMKRETVLTKVKTFNSFSTFYLAGGKIGICGIWLRNLGT